MKYDNLGYQLQNKMKKEYDSRHADEMPTEPTARTLEEEDRKVIRTSNKTHIYVSMETPNRRMDYASAYLRLVSSTQHVEIELPLDKLDDIIGQLQMLQTDMQNQKSNADKYSADWRQYVADKEAYEDKRERDLIKALSSGKITENQIRTELEIITF